MIQFNNVSLMFSGNLLFEDVSFSVQKGERCGLVGRNGSGKSTLFRLIKEEVEQDKGSISVPKNYKIGYLQQHIQFIESTLIKEAARALPPNEHDHIYKAEKILFGLGFNDKDLNSSPRTFSGGFHLRLHLAKVLIAEPNCLLLDEPTNYLDILSIKWLSNFLNNWPGEFILISHDRDFMDGVTNQTIGIHRQKVRKIKGSSLDFFQQILVEEEVYEKTRIKLEKKKERVQNFVQRFSAKASKATQAQSKMKILKKEPILEKLNQLTQLSFSFCEADFLGKKMLDAKDLYFSYIPEQKLIQSFSLAVEKGERVAIIGKNGRGKSTLLRLLCSDLMPTKGTIELSARAYVGYFGQTHIDRLYADHTIEQEISLANPQLNYAEVKNVAGKMMFSGILSEKKISILSGGEKSRVLLGKILATPCNFLFLDEPTHHLDIESIEALIDALEAFSGAIIIVTHSELILKRLMLDKIILCKQMHQEIFLGTYEEFLEKKGWEDENNKSPKKNISNQKKEKTKEIAKRSAVLKPIKKQIKVLEEKLLFLEEEQKKDQIILENLNKPSPEFLKSLGLRQKKIVDLETQLYELYELREKKKQELENY